MNEPVWVNEDLQRINTLIERYAEDTAHNHFNNGYDEGFNAGEESAWDEARNKGFDEGWEDACQYILDTFLHPVGFVTTPETIEHLQAIIEQQQPFAAAAVVNYLHARITELKVDK